MRYWLKELRENKGYTQQNVAESMGVTKQYYQQIEARDRQQKLNIETLQKIASLFNVSMDFIIQSENALNAEIEYQHAMARGEI